MGIRRWLGVSVAVAGVLGMGLTWAQTAPNYRALLVGVSTYPNLSEALQLKGPKNDVKRMRELLSARGIPAQNILVLADGVDGAELPTRLTVLASLEHLARTAKPNDYIVILMGGHGSQQPVPVGHPQAGAEPDGLFEIFLPRDVKGWSNQSGGGDGEVHNAILDHEIRALVDRMTAAGAFVWAIFDTCHSATMVRSAGNPEVRLRQVTPAELGISQEAVDRAAARARSQNASKAPAAAGTATPGQAVYFYAAQTHEPTPEAALPYGVPGRVPHGLFSFSVMQTLESASGPMSYEQLGQQVLTRYAAATGERTATPLFTGTALKAGVMGQASVPHRQWLIRREGQAMSIPGGALAEVYEGSVLAVLPNAVAKTDEAVGYVRVSRATATAAQLEPVAFGGKPAASESQLSEGRVVRMVQQGVQFALNVGTDLSECAKPCAFEAPLSELRKQPTGGVAGAQVKWQSTGEGADLVLKAQGKRLWLLPASATQVALPKFPEKHFAYLDAASGASATGIKAELSRFLQHASKATNLLRIATSVAGNPATAALQIDIKLISGGAETPLKDATVKPGDKIRVTMRNTGRTQLDVTAFYLSSQFGVDVMYPFGDSSNRLESRDEQSFEISFDDSTLGLERLAIVAVETEKHGERVNLSFLSQDRLEGQTVTRGRGVGDLFSDAGFATHVTRGAKASAPPSSTGMQVYTFRVQPK